MILKQNPKEIIQMVIEALTAELSECLEQKGGKGEIPPTTDGDNGYSIEAGASTKHLFPKWEIMEGREDLYTLERLLKKDVLSEHDIARVVLKWPDDNTVANVILLPVRKAVQLPGGVPVLSWDTLLGKALRNGEHVDAEILSVKYG